MGAVGVLPDVVPDQRGRPAGDGVVLVGAAGDLQCAATEVEPGPPRAELIDARGLELLLEGVERPERVVERVRKLT
jgi:hypothetical protein